MIDGAVGAVPFGMVGVLPRVERGWVKKCPQGSQWSKQQPNRVGTVECGQKPLTGFGK